MPARPGVWRQNEADYWQQAGKGWLRWESFLLNSLAAVDPVLLRALDARPGHRVLDVGCGLGEPALAVAPLVRPGGRVLGLDISASMLAAARRRARVRHAGNVRFRCGDISRFRWRGVPFDRVVSRYGIMFGDDPGALLARIHACLRAGGKAAFAVWGPPRRNPTFAIRERAALPFVGRGGEPLESAPGPMRFARSGRLARLMREAGFGGVRQVGVPVAFLHASPEAFAEFTLETSLSEVVAGLGPDDRRRLARRLARGVRPYRDAACVRVPAHAWVVSGRRR